MMDDAEDQTGVTIWFDSKWIEIKLNSIERIIAPIVLNREFNGTTLDITNSNLSFAWSFYANPIRMVCPSDVLLVVMAFILNHLFGLLR